MVLSMPLALAACSPEPLDNHQSTTASAAHETAAPEVDRSGSGNFPEVTGAFGEKPQFTPGTGEEPKVISVRTLHEGNGAVIGENDYISVNYAGVLWDATPFDSSFDRGQPTSFSLNGVIAGWKYGLAGQKVGDRVQLVIPAQWGYGEQGTGNIPGGATLVFVVDILGVTDVTNTDALSTAQETGNTLPGGITIDGKLGQAPTVTYAAGQAPEQQQIVVIAEGTGEKTTADKQMIVRTVGASQGGEPSVPAQWNEPQVVPAHGTGLEGINVGSRVLIVRPGLGEGQPAVAIVVDIVGVM